MKKILVSALVLSAGIAVGGGAAIGTSMAISGDATMFAPDMAFVSTGEILTPLVFPDGRLAGYVKIEGQIEVPASQTEDVIKRLPILLNAVNMRTFRTPMTSGPDGMLPNVESFRKLLLDAAVETYGRDIVTRAVVTQASPV